MGARVTTARIVGLFCVFSFYREERGNRLNSFIATKSEKDFAETYVGLFRMYLNCVMTWMRVWIFRGGRKRKV